LPLSSRSSSRTPASRNSGTQAGRWRDWPLAVKTRGARRAILRFVHVTRPAATALSPETASQAGAGALLLGIALAELLLAFWSAGWWHRSAALAVAVVGIVLLVRAATAIGLAPRVPAVGVSPLRPTAARTATPRVVLAK
jgi:hypothetical protein